MSNLRRLASRLPAAKRLYLRWMIRTRPTFAGPKDTDFTGQFNELLAAHSGLPTQRWIHYGPVYDEVLARYVSQSPRVLEVGVAGGGSMELWRKFFGEGAQIVGLDSDPSCANLGLKVFTGSQTDRRLLHQIVQELGGLDIVIDDGSHLAGDQRSTFDILFPLLSERGVYIIEDSHTSYLWSYGGGFRRPGTAVQFCKSLVDGIHGWHHRTPLTARSKMARDLVRSVKFFDSLIVIEKERRTRPSSGTFGRGRDLGDAQWVHNP